MTTEFKENHTVEEKPLPLYRQKYKPQAFVSQDNFCVTCGKKASNGVYMVKDARGGKSCSVCIKEGKAVKAQKLNKSERRGFKKFKREMTKARKIPHITLDAEGNPVG